MLAPEQMPLAPKLLSTTFRGEEIAGLNNPGMCLSQFALLGDLKD